MIEIHLLEQLVAFADCGTLSGAAEKLHISQPALSRSMQRLEEELGVTLFERQRSRLTLNDMGELAVRYARNLLLQENAMIQQIREADRKKRTIRGILRACADPRLCVSPLPALRGYDHLHRADR